MILFRKKISFYHGLNQVQLSQPTLGSTFVSFPFVYLYILQIHLFIYFVIVPCVTDKAKNLRRDQSVVRGCFIPKAPVAYANVMVTPKTVFGI